MDYIQRYNCTSPFFILTIGAMWLPFVATLILVCWKANSGTSM